MITALSHVLGIVALGQAVEESGVSGAVFGLGLALVIACLALAWVFVQRRATQRRLATLAVEHQSITDTHRELLEKERKQAKTLDTKRDEITELKRDMATQRKKTHAAQEEEKKLRKDLRQQSDEMSKSRDARPAFKDTPEEKAPEPKKTPVKAEVTRSEAPEKKKTEQSDSEIAKKLSKLEAEYRAQKEAFGRDRDALHTTRDELRQLRRRVEGLRRIDLISTGKIELLEDRLRGLGRKYYDAVSELAALKGEVRPPRPRDVVPERPRQEESNDETMDEAAFDEQPEPETNADAEPAV